MIGIDIHPFTAMMAQLALVVALVLLGPNHRAQTTALTTDTRTSTKALLESSESLEALGTFRPPTPPPTPLLARVNVGHNNVMLEHRYQEHGDVSALEALIDDTCTVKCVTAGHCCRGMTSACNNPSCAMGCAAGAVLASEAACNASCTATHNASCSYHVPGSNLTFNTCGVCQNVPAPNWWPASATPPNGQPPGFWPPGYSLANCNSCDSIDGDPAGECKLGCMFAFRPSMKPQPPPVPEPPAPGPPSPACGVFPSNNGVSECIVGGDVNFSNVFSDHAVLQMQPAQAAVYGYIGTNATKSPKVIVTVKSTVTYTVDAIVDTASGMWKALLKPSPGGGNYTIAVSCSSGCTGYASIADVTFGDVWYCTGQSNMALPFQFTYSRNGSLSKIMGGNLQSLRITGIKGNMNADQTWISVSDAAGVGISDDESLPPYGSIPLDHFSSTCFYFGEALVEGLSTGIPIGLIHTAWGGSMIEQWLTNEAIAECKGSNIASHNEQLYENAVEPYIDMSLKGWVYYQGENNCGGLHGNSGTASQPASGYACMMPKLVELFRSQWSKTSGTTDPNASFGIVSLSSHDSEGSKDMASFRWAQQGSYGTVPNKIMSNTFMAHGFDLQDPWNGNTGACLSNPFPGYDCRTPWFMGPGIHPRLKKPVGQRLALGAMKSAYNVGDGSFGGVIQGCNQQGNTLTLMFSMGNRNLDVRPYNSSKAASATAVLVNGTWYPVSIASSGPSSVAVDLTGLPGEPTAVRYAWGDVGGKSNIPNGDDVSCCEGNGVDQPCVPVQCPLVARELFAPFGYLPVDPFIAEISKDGSCICPEPQECSTSFQ